VKLALHEISELHTDMQQTPQLPNSQLRVYLPLNREVENTGRGDRLG